MKKHLFFGILFCLSAMPFMGTMAETVVDGQSTEGKDFWVTFMQADQDPNNDLTLSLSISSREDCQVTISNPFTGYSETIAVTANQMQLIELYSGNVLVSNARSAMETSGKVCYSTNSEKVDTCALHVTSTANISLFATNYKRATFDATNVLPTASLLDEYIIQTYTPSDHGGASATQGSHFAVIAAEDNTIIDYCPSVNTEAINEALGVLNFTNDSSLLTPEQLELVKYKYGRDTLHSPVLMKGQVWYVWTGKKDNHAGDLSGTFVRARDGKKIAVFQGCPHTNIPYQTKERDHIFSQAMPTKYWGNTFVLSTSAGRHVDFIRILALNDGTEVRINGTVVHTFDFTKDTKKYWECKIGEQGEYAKDGSCVITTSCPCATHLFMASKKADNVEDGDPAMIWVNPIEQQIDQVTFATYASKNGTTSHYVNVVTDQPDLMTLDSLSIAANFKPVSGSNRYYYAQISLGNAAATHTLKSNGSNFIAHVYGFTKNESYGYSAGGATKPLTQYITINGQIFSADTENNLCGEDTVHFACHPDYEYEKIEWYFGDGKSDLTNKDSVPHYYEKSGVYSAYVLIYRNSSNLCVGQSAVDSIPIRVTIGRYVFSIDGIEIPCPEDGKEYVGKVFYTNEGNVNLHGDNVTIEFDDAALAAGFKNEQLVITDEYFKITIPKTAKPETTYGIHLVIKSDCGGADTTMNFMINYDNDVITQRYDNVLGLLASSFEGKELSDFQWYRTSDSTAVEGQVSSNLNFYDLPNGEYENDAYYVCFTINKGKADEVTTCACAKAFDKNNKTHNFAPDALNITATYSTLAGDKVFVNADFEGEKDIECYAQWINASGKVVEGMQFQIPDGGCTIPTPEEDGLYLLRVITDKKSRSFKFIINK